MQAEKIYIFQRVDGWYPIELDSDEEAAIHAACNPGTLKVINAHTGKVVWESIKKEDGA